MPDGAAEDIAVDVVGATQSGQKVTEMLPMLLVMVSGDVAEDETAAELVVGGAESELGALDDSIADDDNGVFDASPVADGDCSPIEETTDNILLTRGGRLIVGSDELLACAEELIGRAGELIAGIEELVVATDALIATELLGTLVGAPELDTDLPVKVAIEEVLEVVDPAAVALVDVGKDTVLATQALLIEFDGAVGELRKATWIAPMIPERVSWKCSPVPPLR